MIKFLPVIKLRTVALTTFETNHWNRVGPNMAFAFVTLTRHTAISNGFRHKRLDLLEGNVESLVFARTEHLAEHDRQAAKSGLNLLQFGLDHWPYLGLDHRRYLCLNHRYYVSLDRPNLDLGLDLGQVVLDVG